MVAFAGDMSTQLNYESTPTLSKLQRMAPGVYHRALSTAVRSNRGWGKLFKNEGARVWPVVSGDAAWLWIEHTHVTEHLAAYRESKVTAFL